MSMLPSDVIWLKVPESLINCNIQVLWSYVLSFFKCHQRSKILRRNERWFMLKLMGAVYESCHDSWKPLGDCVRVVKLLNCMCPKWNEFIFFKKKKSTWRGMTYKLSCLWHRWRSWSSKVRVMVYEVHNLLGTWCLEKVFHLSYLPSETNIIKFLVEENGILVFLRKSGGLLIQLFQLST